MRNEMTPRECADEFAHLADDEGLLPAEWTREHREASFRLLVIDGEVWRVEASTKAGRLRDLAAYVDSGRPVGRRPPTDAGTVGIDIDGRIDGLHIYLAERPGGSRVIAPEIVRFTCTGCTYTLPVTQRAPSGLCRDCDEALPPS